VILIQLKGVSLKAPIYILIISISFTYAFEVLAQNSELLVKTIDEYKKNILKIEQRGGMLYCEDSSKRRDAFNSCKSFHSLQKRGCYGSTTYEMGNEINYKRICKKIAAIGKATSSSMHFFNLDSKEWWKSLPASIIPIPGGIYNDQLLEHQKLEDKKLLSKRLLGKVNYESVTNKSDSVEIILSSSKEDCGVVQDELIMKAVLLADFDGDGISEMLIEGTRADYSETCHLGSGNRLGAGFSVLVKKNSKDAFPSVFPYSK